MAFSLFLKNKKALIAACVICAILIFIRYYYSCVYRVQERYITPITFYELMQIVAYIFMTVLVILSDQGYAKTEYIWFVPGVLLFLGLFISNIEYVKGDLNSFGGWKDVVFLNSAIVNYIEPIALIFTGLWIKVSPLFINNINNHKIENQNITGGADKLKAYKDLLDSGAITQEEFEQKKREILK